MKTLTFHKPILLSKGSFETDVVRYRFPFSVVKTSLIGSPEEKSQTVHSAITVGISCELRINWRLLEATEGDLAKLLFEFGKRHVVDKLQLGHLGEEEELNLTTQSAPEDCPYEISRITDPHGASLEVTTEENKASTSQQSQSSEESAAQVNSNITSSHPSHITSLRELRKKRSEFALIQLYQDTGGSHSQPCGLEAIAKAETWNSQETREVYEVLANQSLVEPFPGGLIRLTHQGIIEAEKLLENDTVKRRRVNRVRVLEKVYEVTRQQGPTQLDLEPIMRKQEISGPDIDNVYEYLIAEGVIRSYGGGYNVIMLPEHQIKAEEVLSPTTEIEIFFCYSHEDEKLRDQLAKHLRLMQREGLISAWHDRKISGGQEWEGQISSNLERARIILLLVSADFIDSEYCWNTEMKRAMAKHEAGTARVIPIILRRCEWSTAPFAKLQALPKDAVPVMDSKWHSLDDAFYDIAQGIRKVVNELRQGAKNPQ